MSSNSLLKQWNLTSPEIGKKTESKKVRDQVIMLDSGTEVRVTREMNQNKSKSTINLKNGSKENDVEVPRKSYPCFRGVRESHPPDPEEMDFYLLDGTNEIVRYNDPDFELLD